MKRSVQEIIELLVFGLIAVLIGTGLLWVVGWVIGGLGALFTLLAGLIWSLLRFVVPIAVVGAAVYALVRLLQGQREPTTVKPTSTPSYGAGATGTTASSSGVTGTASSGVDTSGADSNTAAPSSTPPSPPPPAATTSTIGTEPASQRKPVDGERTDTLRNETEASKPGQDVRRPMGAAHGEAGDADDAGAWKSTEQESDEHDAHRHDDEHAGREHGEDEHESDDDEDRR